MQFNTEGLVLNEMNVGETDRLVTVLTKKEGVLRAFAKQANRTSSGKLAATRLFCCAFCSTPSTFCVREHDPCCCLNQ